MQTAMLALIAAALCGSAPVRAEGAADPVSGAMKAELSRTMGELRMGKLPAPYFAAYTLRQGRALVLRAAFGALLEREEYPYGQIKAQVRVGSPGFDNSHFAGRDFWNFGPHTGQATFEPLEGPVRFELWSLTDQAYKASLERLSAKKAYRQSRNIVEDVADWSAAQVAKRIEPLPSGAAAQAQAGLWAERVRRLSSVFRDFPKVQASHVSLSWGQEATYFLDSEGSEFRLSSPEVELSITGETQAEDGMNLLETRNFLAFSPEQLPSEEVLTREARSLGRDLSGLAGASTGTLYVGPVVFEGQAAAEFFNQLLARNVSFPQPVWTENEEDKKYFDTGALADRLGMRVASPFLDAADDPSLENFGGVPLFGHYRIDDEGVPAQRVSLVEQGVLKDVFMSRAPIRGRSRSNGHGRAGFYEHPSGRVGNLLIEPRQAVPAGRLKDELLRLCREQGLEYGLWIRRMAAEDRREPEQLLAPPVAAYKVFAKDGREEPVRGLEFSEVTLLALRGILAASEERAVYNFYQLGPVHRSRGGVPASIVAPSILVRELELKPTQKKPAKRPYLPHPYFETLR